MSNEQYIGLIGIEELNGTVEYIQCRFLSDPNFVGYTLQTRYQSSSKVQELIDGGNVRVLYEDSVILEKGQKTVSTLEEYGNTYVFLNLQDDSAKTVRAKYLFTREGNWTYRIERPEKAYNGQWDSLKAYLDSDESKELRRTLHLD